MKRVYLIAGAAVVLLAGSAAGSVFFLRPALVFGHAGEDSEITSAPVHVTKFENGAERNPHLSRLVERLGAVQDRLIHGDNEALDDQNRLLFEIATAARHLGADGWNDYANLRASFGYVLSGGDAQVLKPVVDNKSLGEADQSLARGIMNFALGQNQTALKYFEDIDPRSLDVSLVGPFALAKASLYFDQDQAKAIDLFDEARLASPHTAIEEAAVRREVPLLLDKGNTGRALMLTTDYVRRFGKSLYARKLFRDFSVAAAKLDELDNAELAENLSSYFDATDSQVRSDFFIDLASEALLRGRLKLAKAAAREVLKIKGAPEANLEKANLYVAAAEAPSLQAVDSLKALDQIAADRLSDEDTEIREVAGFIARIVAGRDMPDAPQAGAVRPQESAFKGQENVAEGGEQVPQVTSAIEGADAALREADLMILGSKK